MIFRRDERSGDLSLTYLCRGFNPMREYLQVYAWGTRRTAMGGVPFGGGGKAGGVPPPNSGGGAAGHPPKLPRKPVRNYPD